MLLFSVLCAVRTVASLYRQAFAPNTPALTTAPQLSNTLLPRCCASGTTIGIATAYKPHEEPVVTEMTDSDANTITGSNSLLTYGDTDCNTYCVRPILSVTSFST